MSFTEEELTKLRAELPRGAAAKLAKQFGMKNAGSVRNILSGLSQNEQVIIAAVKMAREHQDTVLATKSLLATS